MAVRLLEREVEMAAVAGLLERARLGMGGVVVLEGPAGIGKTALLDHAAVSAGGVRVLRATGGELEGEYAFGFVRELLAPLQRASREALQRSFAGPAAAAAAVFGDARGAAADVAAVVFGLYWMFVAIAESGPVAVLADDVQAADPASRRWLEYLVRRVDGVGLAVLVAGRPGTGLGSPTVLAAAARVAVTRLHALSPAGTGRLLEDEWQDTPPGVVETCHRVTGGNPWLIGELVEDLRAAGSSPGAVVDGAFERLVGVQDGVRGRLLGLGDPAVRLAQAIAVLGDGCELPHAGKLAELMPAEADHAVTALVGGGHLVDGQRLAFAHPLVRAAVRDSMPVAVRAAAHSRAAALLRTEGAAGELIAGQLLASSPVRASWAAGALLDTAESALARGAPETAVRHLRRALEELPASEQSGTLRALGNALARLADPAATGVLERALRTTTDPGIRSRIADEAVDPLMFAGRPEQARSLVLSVLPDAPTELRADLLAGRLAMIQALQGGAVTPAVAGLRARAASLDEGESEARYALAALALLAAVSDGTAADAQALALRAVGRADVHEADARAGRPNHIAVVALALAGDHAGALLASERALAVARARGSLLGQGAGLGWRGLLQLLAGDLAQAELDAQAARAILSGVGRHAQEPASAVTIALALIERGALDEAQRLLGALPEGQGWLGAGLRCVRARVALEHHRPAEALAQLGSLRQPGGDGNGWRSGAALPWRSLAGEALLMSGEKAAAARLADADLAAARAFGAPRDIGVARRSQARAAGGEGLATLQLAVGDLRRADAPLELARTLVDVGAMLRRDGQRKAARPPLLEALELAHRCGAGGLVDRARHELRAVGARPRSVMRTGVDALTPSERRVAELAAAGLTNAETAQTLFVTTRTVETHLTAAYRKLGIRSRTALSSVL
jgi:DNA-binding CsgD family transcriptional regulator